MLVTSCDYPSNLLLGLGAGLLARSSRSSKQGTKIAHGVLGSDLRVGPSVSVCEAFHLGLRDLGYEDGKNPSRVPLAAEKYERLPGLAADLVRSKVDVIVTYGTPGTVAAKHATTVIPIVMIVSGDAVAAGYRKPRAPGGKSRAYFFVLNLWLNG